jgi:hypothetical protein
VRAHLAHADLVAHHLDGLRALGDAAGRGNKLSDMFTRKIIYLSLIQLFKLDDVGQPRCRTTRKGIGHCLANKVPMCTPFRVSIKSSYHLILHL